MSLTGIQWEKENMMIPKSSFSMQEDAQISRINLSNDVDVRKKKILTKISMVKKRIKK